MGELVPEEMKSFSFFPDLKTSGGYLLGQESNSEGKYDT